MKRNWLIELRKSLKLTQKDVAQEAGISRCYYTQIENGTRNPTGQTALKLSHALGVSMEYFFTQNVDNNKNLNQKIG